ncbi:MAG TPA: hypothetical protein VG267_08210 [Terracidiphilus sp.]|jgi:hypothetical protein|nr:hypothetical protein [Terracidiphilus sp.]
MRRVGWVVRTAVVAGAVLLALPVGGPVNVVQAQETEAAKNAQQARAELDAMIQALGGQAWLDQKNVMRHGFVAGFYHGNPDLGTTEVYEFYSWPDKFREEVTKHRDVMEFYAGNQGFEVNYRGKRALPQEDVDQYIRRRDHSIETAAKLWLKDPKTILVWEGKHLAQRHMADQVTLISGENEAVTILLDEDTHLPLERRFQWRDPLYHDKNTDTEDYDDYHTIDGFPTPLRISRGRNGEDTRQFYIKNVEYNRTLPDDFWDVDAAARKLKKK